MDKVLERWGKECVAAYHVRMFRFVENANVVDLEVQEPAQNGTMM